MNYVIGHAAPPRFAANAKIARIDIDADEIASSPRKVDIGIVGDCKAVLQQLLAAMPGRVDAERFASWRKKLGDGEAAEGPGGADDDVDLVEAVIAQLRRDQGHALIHHGL